MPWPPGMRPKRTISGGFVRPAENDHSNVSFRRAASDRVWARVTANVRRLAGLRTRRNRAVLPWRFGPGLRLGRGHRFRRYLQGRGLFGGCTISAISATGFTAMVGSGEGSGGGSVAVNSNGAAALYASSRSFPLSRRAASGSAVKACSRGPPMLPLMPLSATARACGDLP
jgi:hypothetical protein